MENCSVFYYESQQACQVHGLVGTDDSSPYIRQIDVNTLDMRIAQVNAPERSMRKFRFYQLAIGKSDGSQLAVVEVAVTQIAGGELRLIDFTHGKIEVSRIAILHPAMIQDCFWQICAYQFTGNEFYPKKRAFCK